MATGDDLLRALSQSRYTAAEDPFGVAATTLGGSLPGLANPYDSTGRQLAHSVGGGLLAALLGGWARSRTDANNAELGALQSQFLKGDQATQDALLAQEPRLAPLRQALLAGEIDQRNAVQTELAKKQALRPLEHEGMIADENAKATIALNKELGQVYDEGSKTYVPVFDPIERDAARERAIIQARQDMERTLPGLEGVPPEMRDAALVEKGQIERLSQVEKSIEDIYGAVSQAGGVDAAMPFPTDDRSALQAARTRIEQLINATTGREANDQSVVRALEGFGPQWYDSPELRAWKKDQLKAFIKNDLSKPTPVLNAIGQGDTPAQATTPLGEVVMGPDGQSYVFTD